MDNIDVDYVTEEDDEDFIISSETAKQLWDCMKHAYIDALDYPLIRVMLAEIAKRYDLS